MSTDNEKTVEQPDESGRLHFNVMRISGRDAVAFNLNWYLFFRITPFGEQAYKEHYHNYNITPPILKKNSDGFIEMQAWQVFDIFGKYISIGMEVPFETNIYLEVKGA